MGKRIVIGLGFGDEGKGLVTDWLAGQILEPVIERYSGGHQAGHRVVRNGISHIFSNFSSGTLAGGTTRWNAETFEPIGFLKELKLLQSKGINPEIMVNPLCPVTTPKEMTLNRINSEKNMHGSVGVGFGETIAREQGNNHIYFADLFVPRLLDWKLKSIYGFKLNEFYESFDKAVNELRDLKGVFLEYLKGIYVDILESSQGILLDMDYGIFPQVTRSRIATQKFNVDTTDEIFLVTRSYQTRHGAGPCNAVKYTVNAPNESNTDDGFQGKFKVRVLDLDLLHYAINIDPGIRNATYTKLIVTCMDQHPDPDKIPLIENGEVKYYTEKEFLKHIGQSLGYSHIYASYGETAEDIKLITL